MTEIVHNPTWTRLESLSIQTEHDIVIARQTVRHHAKSRRLGIVEQTRITTAVSELFRNMYHYADGGEVWVDEGEFDGHNALIITCTDKGPGIEDLDLAMSDGYTSGQGMGYGMPGAKRLVDHFEVHSVVGEGTTVRVMKWI